jgi:hypothetical protein
MSLNKIANPSANFVADSAKDLYSLVVGTFRLCRIIDRPMLAKADAGEDRAAVSRAIADSDDMREMPAEETDYYPWSAGRKYPFRLHAWPPRPADLKCLAPDQRYAD